MPVPTPHSTEKVASDAVSPDTHQYTITKLNLEEKYQIMVWGYSNSDHQETSVTLYPYG